MFHHMTTYEEMNVTNKNHFDLPAWSFASVEALGEGSVYMDYPYLDGQEQPLKDTLYTYAASTNTLGSTTVRVEAVLNR